MRKKQSKKKNHLIHFFLSPRNALIFIFNVKMLLNVIAHTHRRPCDFPKSMLNVMTTRTRHSNRSYTLHTNSQVKCDGGALNICVNLMSFTYNANQIHKQPEASNNNKCHCTRRIFILLPFFFSQPHFPMRKVHWKNDPEKKLHQNKINKTNEKNRIFIFARARATLTFALHIFLFWHFVVAAAATIFFFSFHIINVWPAFGNNI